MEAHCVGSGGPIGWRVWSPTTMLESIVKSSGKVATVLLVGCWDLSFQGEIRHFLVNEMNSKEDLTANKYICETWQGFLQELVTLVSHGYFYFDISRAGEDKRSRLTEIDDKLLNKFKITWSKDRHYRNKKAGRANYRYFRWNDCIAVLKTEGEPLSQVATHPFKDIRKTPLIFKPIKQGELELRIGKKQVKLGRASKAQKLKHSKDKKDIKGFTVWLTNEYYRELKVIFMEMIEKKQVKKLEYRFNALNNLPAYAGIIQHKRLLLNDLKKAARKHGIKLNGLAFQINTYLNKQKVFND